jgi:hypothetical protein
MPVLRQRCRTDTGAQPVDQVGLLAPTERRQHQRADAGMGRPAPRGGSSPSAHPSFCNAPSRERGYPISIAEMKK